MNLWNLLRWPDLPQPMFCDALAEEEAEMEVWEPDDA